MRMLSRLSESLCQGLEALSRGPKEPTTRSIINMIIVLTSCIVAVVLGGSGDLVTTYIWAYNPTCSLPNWPYMG